MLWAASLLLALPSAAPAAQGAKASQELSWRTKTDFGGKKEYGGLLLVPAGGSEWSTVLAELRKSAPPGFAVESAEASNTRAIQASVDRLQAKRVKKIVAVPLLLSSHAADMDQNRYIFGVRQFPSADFQGGPHAHAGYSVTKRARSKVEMVLTQALDDHPTLAEIVADRAQAQSKDPAREAVILVAQASKTDIDNPQWSGTVQSLTDKVRKGTRFKSVQLFLLPFDAPQDERVKTETGLRAMVKGLAAGGTAIVVPLSLGTGPERRLRKIFDGLFVKFSGKPVLPDKKIAGWVSESLESGAKLPDMRTFKKDENPPPAPLANKRTLQTSSSFPQFKDPRAVTPKPAAGTQPQAPGAAP
ncbi:MAG: hypothetical protein HY927_10505 [Elusimicrobia bacterium]|nr:hypothetical protein [Elusimicrobiota bacterium]